MERRDGEARSRGAIEKQGQGEEWMKKVLAVLKDALLPPRCLCCGALVVEEAFCPVCAVGLMPDEDNYCVICNQTIRAQSSVRRCLKCAGKKSPYLSVHMAFEYGGPIREALLALKHNGRRDLGPRLGRVLAKALRATLPDDITCVVPVPLHRSRLLDRGYNQAALLAAELSRLLEVPLDLRMLERHRATPATRGCNRQERRQLVAGAFAVATEPDLQAGTVLLVDDVATTFSTLSECSKTLSGAGVSGVRVAALARAVVT
jgi:ComF family protein